MANKKPNLSDYIGKYIQLEDGRKGFVLAPPGMCDHDRCMFLTLRNRLDEMTFTLETDDGFRDLFVWRELGTMDNEPMQPHSIISSIKGLISDGKKFREIQRLLK